MDKNKFNVRIRIEISKHEATSNAFSDYELNYYNLSYEYMHELQKTVALKLLELGDNNCH